MLGYKHGYGFLQNSEPVSVCLNAAVKDASESVNDCLSSCTKAVSEGSLIFLARPIMWLCHYFVNIQKRKQISIDKVS